MKGKGEKGRKKGKRGEGEEISLNGGGFQSMRGRGEFVQNIRRIYTPE